ncbi:MAG: DUF3795 domain-containing protein [Planctomycetes bacterium]|nr:DUF3795 domain-containing protein [Planctomycetota bacterium]
MSEILTLCGYRCDLCQFYTENITCEADKERVSRDFKRLYGFEVKPEDVECVGCKNEGKHADKDCPIRPCALAKGVENCAHCPEFICEKLQPRINFTEDFLKNNKKLLSDEAYGHFVKPYHNKERMVQIHQAFSSD